MAPKKSPRTMILDRFAAGYVNVDCLAIEEAGNSVRVTGTVPSEDERQRVLNILSEAQSEGIQSTHAVEVRAAASPNQEAASISDLRGPAEPA